MSKLTFISNTNAHIASGAITAAAAGVSGIWDLGASDWQGAAALLATDQIQLVQGRGAAAYPIFSQIFTLSGTVATYTPYVQAVKQVNTVTIAAVAGVGTIHTFKLVRRATDIGYSNMINGGTDDFSYTDKLVTLEYVEKSGDNVAAVCTGLQIAAAKLGPAYGWVATKTATTVIITAAEFGHQFDCLNFASATVNTLAVTAPVEGSGNYHQVLSAEKQTQAMHGYHGRAGSFLNTPETFTSAAIAPVATSATLGYDALTLVVPNSTSGNAAGDASASTSITIYFDGVDANMTSLAAMFALTGGTAKTIIF
jgi:hypothetical protein